MGILASFADIHDREGDMTKLHKTRAAAVTGFMTASTLVFLVLVAVGTAAPQVAPVTNPVDK